MPRSYAQRRCSVCGRTASVGEILTRGRGVCWDCRDEGHAPRADMAALVVVTRGARYRDDVGAQLFVSHFVGGASDYAVGLAFGLTRQRVAQIQQRAIDRLVRAAKRLGVDLAALRDAFTSDDHDALEH